MMKEYFWGGYIIGCIYFSGKKLALALGVQLAPPPLLPPNFNITFLENGKGLKITSCTIREPIKSLLFPNEFFSRIGRTSFRDLN